MKHSYKIGESAVHLSHGIGIITAVETREFPPHHKQQQFYIMEIDDNGAPKKVYIPVETAETRLRRIITKAEAKAVIAILNGTTAVEPIDSQTWNRRYREYMERIHTGNAADIASVVVALKQLKKEKDLSFGESKLLEQAVHLIHTELSMVEGLDVVFID